MAQTQSDPSQQSLGVAPSATPPPTPPRPRAADDDPLAHLHKMSTTAGLGSGEYVAVNSFAVFALILGLASLLTLIENLLLIIPLACVVISVIAWRQINQSNGTQTGKGLIAVALLCALGVGGFVFAREATEGVRTRNDRFAIDRTLVEWGGKIKSGDFAGAHQMLAAPLREQLPPETFNVRMGFFRQSELYGALQNATTNGLVMFDTNPETDERYAKTKLTMHLEKTSASDEVTLRKEEGRWVITAMPNFLPPPRPPGQQGGAPGQPPGQQRSQ